MSWEKKPTVNKDCHVMHGEQGLYPSSINQHGVRDTLRILGLDTCRFEFYLTFISWLGKHFSELIVNSHCKVKILKTNKIDVN